MSGGAGGAVSLRYDVRDLEWIQVFSTHQANVIQEWGRGGSRNLQVPCFIKEYVVARFYNISVDVDISKVDEERSITLTVTVVTLRPNSKRIISLWFQ